MMESPPEHHNPIRVRPFFSVRDAPTIGSFGKFLRVDENQLGAKTGGDSAFENRLFQLYLAVPHLADFEGDMAPRFENAAKFGKDPPHRRFPIREFFGDG